MEVAMGRCEPELKPAVGGQWLATSPPDYLYCIGVVGETQEEARQRFTTALAAWEELHTRASQGTGVAFERYAQVGSDA
jgi:predicted RNase H-like HicB family nuclease